MNIEKWNERYRAGEQLFETPSPLVERFCGDLTPGVALDLASGPGRNALYLAERGWRVTAVDGSDIAIAKLRARSPRIEARLADLERGEFSIEAGGYDLICSCYYLQRDLFPAIKAGVRPGGMVIVIVRLDDAEATPTRALPGELRTHFADWKILHDYEGQPGEACHRRSVAELVAVR